MGYSVVGLTGHVSVLYKRVPLPGTMCGRLGVKGQPPPLPSAECSSPWYLCFSRSAEKAGFCAVLLCTPCSCPGAAAFHWPLWGGPVHHQMSHSERPDTICSDHLLPAASRAQLADSRLLGPVTLSVIRPPRPQSHPPCTKDEFERVGAIEQMTAVVASLVLLPFLSISVMLWSLSKK